MSGYFRVGHTTDVQNPTARPPVVVENAEPIRELTVGNVGRYLGAEASMHLHGPVTDEVYEERKAHCLGCPQRHVSDKVADEIGFCKGCGCGISERARLTVKLRMPATSCPDGKFGKAVGRHPRMIDRARAWLVRRMIGA